MTIRRKAPSDYCGAGWILLPSEREAVAGRARPCFRIPFHVNQTALAIEKLFSSMASSFIASDDTGGVSDSANLSSCSPNRKVEGFGKPT